MNELETDGWGDDLKGAEPTFASISFEPTYTIEITDQFHINCASELPNWFHRKMMSLFFGWKFKLNNKDNE